VSDVRHFTALRVDGEEISLGDLIGAARFHGQLGFVDQAVNRALVRAAAARLAIEVSDEELQREADEFRARRRLFAAQATLDWLAAIHLAQEDWEYLLEDEILLRKLRQAVCAARIERHFVENRRAFEAASVEQFVVPEEDVARELRAQCVDDKVPFHDLARQFPAGRFLGKLRRSQMEPLVAAAVFGVQPGEVAGPVRTERGWYLVLVEALHPAALDEETSAEIASALFADWLEEERSKAKVETPLLTDL
jgi:parvulin-like peptidyl-prolyl isomerase